MRRLAAIDLQIDLDPCVIKWEMIKFCDRNFYQFLQSISIISHLFPQDNSRKYILLVSFSSWEPIS
jgi:hypothetical protein